MALAHSTPNITGHQLDVMDGAAVEALVASVSPVQFLLNCAGWVHDGTILDCDEAVWDRAFAVMTHRRDVEMLEIEQAPGEIMSKAFVSGFSRRQIVVGDGVVTG